MSVALSGSRKASEVTAEAFFHGEIQPAFLLHSSCEVSGWGSLLGIQHLHQERPAESWKERTGRGWQRVEAASPSLRVHAPSALHNGTLSGYKGLCKCHLLKDLEVSSHRFQKHIKSNGLKQEELTQRADGRVRMEARTGCHQALREAGGGSSWAFWESSDSHSHFSGFKPPAMWPLLRQAQEAHSSPKSAAAG